MNNLSIINEYFLSCLPRTLNYQEINSIFKPQTTIAKVVG